MKTAATHAPFEARKDGFTISTDPARLDRDLVFRFLHEESYWSAGITRSFFERALDAGVNFGLYEPGGAQIGFARVATDFATLAHLADVFVLPGHRGQGLGRWLVATVLAHPRLQGLRRWTLTTDDAHALYSEFGFVAADPATQMQRLDADAHKREV
ncbi:MAG TPA: GNAT family N-acetyltransferase [Stellaceae bacterium]|nr:GNAT family N-acetyltransferase [Stellaceae bacterium]